MDRFNLHVPPDFLLEFFKGLPSTCSALVSGTLRAPEGVPLFPDKGVDSKVRFGYKVNLTMTSVCEESVLPGGRTLIKAPNLFSDFLLGRNMPAFICFDKSGINMSSIDVYLLIHDLLRLDYKGVLFFEFVRKNEQGVPKMIFANCCIRSEGFDQNGDRSTLPDFVKSTVLFCREQFVHQEEEWLSLLIEKVVGSKLP